MAAIKKWQRCRGERGAQLLTEYSALSFRFRQSFSELLRASQNFWPIRGEIGVKPHSDQLIGVGWVWQFVRWNWSIESRVRPVYPVQYVFAILIKYAYSYFRKYFWPTDRKIFGGTLKPLYAKKIGLSVSFFGSIQRISPTPGWLAWPISFDRRSGFHPSDDSVALSSTIRVLTVLHLSARSACSRSHSVAE